MIRILLTLLLCIASLPAAASPVVADLSNYRIDMDSRFNGTRLFLFGTRNDAGDVIMVIRGPEKRFIVRKKESYFGVWVNSESVKLANVPVFYAIAASKPLDEIEQSGLLQRLGIGQQHLALPLRTRDRERFDEFADAFLRHQRDNRLYTRNVQPLQFMGESLFKSTIEFPDNIPPGEYTAEIYLISDGEVSGMQTTPISVDKTGMDAFIYNAAHRYPALYGISAVLMALGIGWAAGRLFQRT